MGLQSNLDQSRNTVRGAFQNYWLNLDGTVTEKKSWLHRVVRWVQNYFFNTTLSDICTVFSNTVTSYARLSNDFLYNVGNVSLEDLHHQENRLSFVAEFLTSRISWLAVSPEQQRSVEMSLRLLPPFNIKEVKIAMFLKKDTMLPPLSPEVMGKKAPPVKIVVDDKTDLTAILDRYDELVPRPNDPIPEPSFLGKIFSSLSPSKPIKRDDPIEKKRLKEICRCISERDSKKYGHKNREDIYGQAAYFIRQLNVLLQDERTPADRRLQALIEVSKAEKECVPRWLNELEKQCNSLAERIPSIEVFVLRCKEALFQDWFQEIFNRRFQNNAILNDTNHYLNQIATKWGAVFGLSTEVPDLDLTQTLLQDVKLNDLKDEIQQAWEEKGVAAFQERFNLSYRQDIFDVLKIVVEKAKIEKPRDFVEKHYYDSQHLLTRAGVIRLLRETLIC